MEETVLSILDVLRRDESIEQAQLERILRDQNRKSHDAKRTVAKRRVLPYYLKVRSEGGTQWNSWDVSEQLDDAFVSLLRAKPRRTASGVATITVLTKPWPCSSNCIYCPNDVRMPKSYMSDEPACQRAERNFFDPLLQVASRMRVLADMGHNTDKVELIVLGGTWSEYPIDYQLWFTREMYRCLNRLDSEGFWEQVDDRRKMYEELGFSSDARELASAAEDAQREVDASLRSYNAIIAGINASEKAKALACFQTASTEELEQEHEFNETASHRVVGHVIETRPDMVSASHLAHLRALGCTKVQMGIQSLDEKVLGLNSRTASLESIGRAFELLRLFGFKSHVHFMVNLLGSTPEQDKRDYLRLFQDHRLKPDEVKLYPCALVESSGLMREYEQGHWAPYTEDELLEVLASDVLATPPYTRISRMIRDISSKDIVCGNKKTNLRQLVEERAKSVCGNVPIQEMRMREIATRGADSSKLQLEEVRYLTSNTEECFLQWVDADGALAAFLRLSLPKDGIASGGLSLGGRDAMIREVHVYGKVSRLHEAKEGAQHTGLGRKLVARACEIAANEGYEAANVISAIGTRTYYRSLGFEDAGLYQRKRLG